MIHDVNMPIIHLFRFREISYNIYFNRKHNFMFQKSVFRSIKIPPPCFPLESIVYDRCAHEMAIKYRILAVTGGRSNVQSMHLSPRTQFVLVVAIDCEYLQSKLLCLASCCCGW